MASLDNVNIELEMPGEPIHYNNHRIVCCRWMDDLHVKCLDCEIERTEALSDRWSDISEKRKVMYKIYKLAEYDTTCPEPNTNSVRVFGNIDLSSVAKEVNKAVKATNRVGK